MTARNAINDGMGTERLIDVSNIMYTNQGLAVINKRPTPVKIMRKFEGGKISGRLEKPSTVDYDGVYRGRSVVFEAKSVHSLERFDLSRIEPHQYRYLQRCHDCGAIAFVLIDFIGQNKIYLLKFETLRSYQIEALRGGRKSIPLPDFDTHAYEVTAGRVAVDYLKVVDRLWFNL